MLGHIRGFRYIAFSVFFVIVFQVFYYVKEFELGYIFSKMLLPLIGAILALFYLAFSAKRSKNSDAKYLIIFVALYFYVSGVVSSLFFYEQDILTTLTSQAKILPFFVYFFVLFVLDKSRPIGKDLYYGLFLSGFFLAVVYVFIANVINVAEYWTPDSSIFVNDAKGFRIRFPAVLCIIVFFLCAHQFKYKFKLKVAVVFCVIFYFLVFELKQRVELVAVFLALIYIYFESRYLIYLYLVGFCSLLLAYVFFLKDPELLDFLQFSDDTSWLARERQLDYVFDVFRDYPLSFIFGVGKLSEVSEIGYEAYLGYKFTTADLGWVGVLHEYGLLGVALLVYFIRSVYREIDLATKSDDYYYRITAEALRSYLLMSIFLSVVATRFLYLSGVFVAIYAIAVYINNLNLGARGHEK